MNIKLYAIRFHVAEWCVKKNRQEDEVLPGNKCKMSNIRFLPYIKFTLSIL